MNAYRALAFMGATAIMAVPAIDAAAATAPHVRVASIDSLQVPDRPYDENADADRAVDAALARAAHDHKLVLIDLGGNWCPDCRILAGVMALPEVRRFVQAHYDVVSVDVGNFDKNLQIPARFGITGRLEGVPSVLIVAHDGTLVDRGHVAALSDARSMTPQAIADWLASWVK